MAVARRALVWVLAVLLGLTGLAAAAGVVMTRTAFGVERTGRLVLDQLRGGINGNLTVERLTSPSLLRGVTLHGIELTDAEGRPFIRADSARLSYRLRTLLSGALVFDRLTAYGADVTIERLPGWDGWNYERILVPREGAAADTGADRRLVLIRDASVRDSRVTVRLPWDTDANADTARMLLEAVPGGTVRTLRFEDVRANAPRVALQSPDGPGTEVEVRGLSTRAYLWDAPADVRELDGTVTLRDSLVSFEADRVRLPDSRLSAAGTIITTDQAVTYDIELVGEAVALADLQWLHPPIPDDGGGSMRLRIRSRGPTAIHWLARDVDVRSQGNEVTGTFGVVTGDTLHFTDVDLRATPLDLAFLAGLFPGGPALEGLVIGDVRADGPLAALRTSGDVRFRTFAADGGGAESAVRWSGVVGALPPYRLRGLEAELRSVDLAQVAQYAPELRLRGTARGMLRADGSVEDGLRVDGDVTLAHAGQRSAIQGSGRFALGDPPTFDLQFDAQPVALELVAAQFPALEGLRGEARGAVTVAGTLDDLAVDADLQTPAGEVVARGELSLTGERPVYRADGSITGFRLDRVVAGLPETEVTGRFDFSGAGTRAEDAEATVSVDVSSATVAGVEVYGAALRGRVSDGLARVDSFMVASVVGDASARGSIGLVAGRVGELNVSVRADSLLFLEQALFADAVPADLGARAARIDGMVTLEGRVAGTLEEWSAGGTVRARSLVYEDLEVGTAYLDMDWRPAWLRVEGSLDSLRYGTRQLTGAQAQVTFTEGHGTLVANVLGQRSQQLEIETTFEPLEEAVRLGLRHLQLTTRDGKWALADTAIATVGARGLSVDSMVLLRSPARARIRVAGVLPWRLAGSDEVQEASLAVDLDSVRIGELLRVAQTDTLVDGVVTGAFRVSGTATAPRLTGRLDARPFRYGGAVLDSLRAEVEYRNELVEGRFSGWSGGRAILTADARVPLQLALTAEDDRLLDRPMDARVRADGMPAGLAAFLAPGFEDLDGVVQGEFAFTGTPVSPDLQGRLELTGGSAYFEPLAVAYRDVRATARLRPGSLMELEATVATANGRGDVTGTMDLAEPADPAFDLTVTARRLDASRRRDVTAIIDGTATLTGRYTRPVVSGDLQIVRGELNLDEIWRQYQIVQLDTTLFRMLDTAQVSYRPELEPPFLRNLRVTGTTVSTTRGFWLRSRELNAEVSGELGLEVDRQVDDLRLTGTLQVIQGDYQLLARGLPSGRRFSIREGTIEFVGTPGIDPNLDIEAAYRVRRAQGEPINVIASLAGTLQDPRVSLSSDSEIPMTETDLASYLLFGRAGAELTQAELDVASGSSLAVGLLTPMFSSVASTGLQQVASSLGLPLDYIAFSLSEQGVNGYGGLSGAGLLQNAQIEVGFDLASNVSVIGSVRIPGAGGGDDQTSAIRLFGARVEYRPWPTWTVEGYMEDQFARLPSFGTAEISDRKVLGLSLFREWGY